MTHKKYYALEELVCQKYILMDYYECYMKLFAINDLFNLWDAVKLEQFPILFTVIFLSID